MPVRFASLAPKFHPRLARRVGKTAMSQTLLFLLSLPLTVLCVELARRMAVRRARPRRRWMMWAAVLGPLPLLVLGFLPVRPHAHDARP
jgi:hypothetical protein